MINLWHKMSQWSLKAFIPISIGFHLLLLSVLSLSFPDLRINRLPPLDIEVTLLPTVLPVMAVEKPAPKMAPQKPKPKIEKEETPPPPVRKEEPRHLETLPLPMAKEEPIPQETLLPKSPPPVETVVNKTPIEQPAPTPAKTHLKQEEKQENQVKRAEVKEMESTVSKAITAASLPEAVSIMGLKESPPSLREASSREETTSIAIPLPESNGRANPPTLDNGSQEGSATVSKLSSPSNNGKAIFVGAGLPDNREVVYPLEAKKKGLEGRVILKVEVLPDGRAGRIEVKKSSGHHILDSSATEAVRQWKFIPGKEGGAPVSSWAEFPVKFDLKAAKSNIVIPGRSR